MKQQIAEWLCFLFGHDMVSEGELRNERSVWGCKKCLRCKMKHHHQLDS